MKLPAVILAVIAFVAAGYVARGLFRNYLAAYTGGKGPVCLEILGNTTTEDEGRTYIIGSIRNNCSRSFGNVTVLFKLDRTPGGAFELPDAVGYAYVRDVKASEVREFKSALPVSRDASYRFDGFTAY
jgi:hypothetical protein